MSGPYHASLNADGRGDEASDYVAFSPWLGAPLDVPVVHFETLDAGSHAVDASDEADTSVALSTAGTADI